MQRMADSVAGYFVVTVVAIALLTFFAWGLSGPQPRYVFTPPSLTTRII